MRGLKWIKHKTEGMLKRIVPKKTHKRTKELESVQEYIDRGGASAFKETKNLRMVTRIRTY